MWKFLPQHSNGAIQKYLKDINTHNLWNNDKKIWHMGSEKLFLNHPKLVSHAKLLKMIMVKYIYSDEPYTPRLSKHNSA